MQRGVGAVCLVRSERDLLPKFLFLLKYRSSNFRRRFYHSTPEDYKSNDREFLREYMAENGYKRPLDVRFNNIKAIIDIEMDAKDKWTK